MIWKVIWRKFPASSKPRSQNPHLVKLSQYETFNLFHIVHVNSTTISSFRRTLPGTKLAILARHAHQTVNQTRFVSSAWTRGSPGPVPSLFSTTSARSGRQWNQATSLSLPTSCHRDFPAVVTNTSAVPATVDIVDDATDGTTTQRWEFAFAG